MMNVNTANIALILKIGRRQAYGVIVGYKQAHQAIVIMQGNLGPLVNGDKILLNLNTLDVVLIEAYKDESEAA